MSEPAEQPDRGDDLRPADEDALAPAAPGGGPAAERAAERAGQPAGQPGAAPRADEQDAAGQDGQDGKDGNGDEPPGAGQDKPRKGRGIIPVERHEAILARERERRETAERELRRFQGGERVAQVNAELNSIDTRLTAMEQEYGKLLTDGEHDRAAARMRDIRTLERERNQRESDMRIAEATARATEAARFEVARERLEAAYPALNPDSAQFDEQQAETVVDLMQAYQIKHGMTPTEAMQKAALRLLGVAGSRQAAATTVKPRVDAGKVDPEAPARDPGAERRQAAIDKALETARRQPPDLSRAGIDSDKAGKSGAARDVSKMSFAEFAKLSDAELARLRGDVLEA